jgi:hypothetical protein
LKYQEYIPESELKILMGEHEINNEIESSKEFYRMITLNKSQTVNQTTNGTIDKWQ